MPQMELKLEGIALTPEQGKWRRKAEKLAKNVLGPNAAEVDRTGQFPDQNIDALREAGLLGVIVDEKHGGPGRNTPTAVLVTEALAKGCASTAIAYAMHNAGVPMIGSLVDDRQAEMFVQPILNGEKFGAFAMSEPGSGNRIWHMDSFAVEQNGGFVIDSFKSFATSSGHCDYYIVPVRANSSVSATDLSLFIIDGADEHIEPKGEWDGMGLRGNSSRPVHFNNCTVPRINRIGEPTAGFSYMMAYSLPIYLMGLSACYLGICQSAYEAALDHVKGRIHSDTGKRLTEVETVQRYVGEMQTAIHRLRSQILRHAQKVDNATVLFDDYAEAGILDDFVRENPDDPFFIELASCKVSACETAIEVAHKALQVCGGVAYKRGHRAERCYRDARAGSLMAPSDDVLKILIGNQVLGTPQPWA